MFVIFNTLKMFQSEFSLAMFMACFLTKFHMHSSNSSSVIMTKLKNEYRFCRTTCCLHSTKVWPQ